MLEAAFLYLTAQTTPNLRRLGFVGDSIALRARALRQRTSWAPHEQHCHRFIEAVLPPLTRKHTALILGSGLVRDVPIQLLTAEFQHVLLVDAVHLAPIRWRYQTCQFIVRDLSGVANWLVQRASGFEHPLADFIANTNIDLVISANLLSQMPIFPEEWMEKHPNKSTHLPKNLAQKVVQYHLNALTQFSCPVCLITDTHLQEHDLSGTITDQMDLMRGVSLPPPDATWLWNLAPFGEQDSKHRVTHHVSAYKDVRTALKNHT